MYKVLPIIGSANSGSRNLQLLNKVLDYAPGYIQLEETFQAGKLPFYDQALEYNHPDVLYLQNKVSECDFVLLATPEYNRYPSAVLKNLLDWLSRPNTKGDWDTVSLHNKKVMIVSTSSGKGAGKNSVEHTKNILARIKAEVVGEPLSVPSWDEQTDEELVLLIKSWWASFDFKS